MKQIIYLFILGFISISCGDPTVDMDDSKYEPKIVLEAYLIPGIEISNIKISRNFPLGSPVDFAQKTLTDAVVTLKNLTDNSPVVMLVYNEDTKTYKVPENSLEVKFGNTYEIHIMVSIEGKQLNASAQTTVPNSGLEIIDESLSDDSLLYREKTDEGEIKKIEFSFNRSAGTGFYIEFLNALDADVNSFIYSPENAYNDLDKESVQKDLSLLKYVSDDIFVSPQSGISKTSVHWWNVNFYGRYRYIIFAADQNFKEFFRTNRRFQDFDGNLVEPLNHIKGDGIGVFASAVSDTIFFKVKK